jgi:peptidoglycan/LPS O-acetylase OafA/YrhL
MLLADVADQRENNLDALRLIAASLVIVDHAFPIAGREHVFADQLGFTLGGLAVSSFFAMSGYLIARSWDEDPNVLRYVAKRALRLLPALVVAALFCAFVVGAFTSTLPVGEYLRDPLTRSYVWDNSLVFPIQYALPGVFEGNPYPVAVNGSLWSLPIEVVAYGMVLALGYLGILRRRTWVFAVFLVVLFIHLRLPGSRFIGDGVWFHMPVVQLWELLATFLVGTLAYLYRDKLVLSPTVMVALLGIMAVTLKTSMADAVYLVAVPYTLFVVGYALWPNLRRITRPGDVSYGVYIYAFPIQQVLADIRPGTNPWVAAVGAFAITYVLAYGSWRLIEKPALRLKRYVRGHQPSVERTDPELRDRPLIAD